MSSIQSHKKKNNNRKSMANELSKEMNILLENTNINRNKKSSKSPLSTSGSLALPQKPRKIKMRSSSYNNTPVSSTSNVSAYSNENIQHSMSSSYINKHNKNKNVNKNNSKRYIYPDDIEEQYKSLYETESNYTTEMTSTTGTTTATYTSNTHSNEDDYTSATTTNTTDQFSEYTESSDLRTESYDDYTESTSGMPTESFSESYSEPSNIIYNTSQNYPPYTALPSPNGYYNNINNDNNNFQMDERPSRPVQRWSEDNQGGNDTHRGRSLDSRKSYAKARNQRKNKMRNRSYSPSITNLSVNTSHISNLYSNNNNSNLNNYSSTLTNSTNSNSLSSTYHHHFKTLKTYQRDIEKLNKYQNSNMEYLLEILNDIKGK